LRVWGNKKCDGEKGFTILEVLVTILVISVFLLGSLQATVLATLFRIQAQDKQETANWIQQDLELIKYQAFTLDLDQPDSDANPLTIYKTQLTSPPTDVATACSSKTYGTRLQDTLAPLTNPPYPATQSVTINSKPYNVTRGYILTDQNTAVTGVQTNILTISYTVAYASSHQRFKSGTGANNTVTTLSTEILPNAALSCP
jgi:prepilin-type N-terminal cleavage/methylation domain-containing protein